MLSHITKTEISLFAQKQFSVDLSYSKIKKVCTASLKLTNLQLRSCVLVQIQFSPPIGENAHWLEQSFFIVLETCTDFFFKKRKKLQKAQGGRKMQKQNLANSQEQDLRISLFNTLLTSPHRDLDGLHPIHQDIVKQDPLFYRQLASWYWDKGEIRDHKEMFIVNLSLSDFEGHRDIGLAFLRMLPPYEVRRVLDFVRGWETHIPEKEKKERKAVRHGLFRNVPRSMRTEITRYLRERESDNDKFDSVVVAARNHLKRMYAVLRIEPSKRAQLILFDDKPPMDSKLYVLKLIAQEKTPAKQAKLIIEHKIPYRIASTVIKAITPTVLIALINAMSPQELINNVSSLQKRGAFDNPDVKKLIETKLEKAKKSKRVSAYKAKEAAKVAEVSEDVKEKLEAVTDAQIKKTKIKMPTALLIDKSLSLQNAIELGKKIAAMLSAICESDLWVYAFDSMVYPISHPSNSTLADWEKAFEGINAGGNTSCGVAVAKMTRDKRYVEQIIVVTDGGENEPPFFVDAFEKYRTAMGVEPNICFVKVDGAQYSEHVEEVCKSRGIVFDSFRFKGDYYALPNLLPLVSKPSKLDLLDEIMNWPLPVRLSA